MGKAPADQWYWNDWLGDVELQEASTVSRGIWINALCRMWFAKTRGEITGTKEKLARLCNCLDPEFEIFLDEIKTLGFGEVSHNSNQTLTLRNRRMYRDEKRREAARLRQQKHYEKKKSNAIPHAPSDGDLTKHSSSSSSFNKEDKSSLSLKDALFDYKEMIEKTDNVCRTLGTYFKKSRLFFQWRQIQMGNNYPPDVIENCLTALWDYRKTTKKPKAYLDHIMTVERQNATEREGIAEHDARKREELSFDGPIFK